MADKPITIKGLSPQEYKKQYYKKNKEKIKIKARQTNEKYRSKLKKIRQ
jgi:hypothetical protein